ncbi:MAG: hypothetical protein GF355_02790 [Candidatus Eisenbacteria bacterium]|nr:hypothetical protein [Candidatus Eisenbacteria bacterium]
MERSELHSGMSTTLRRILALLGIAVLWAACSSPQQDELPPETIQRIRSAFGLEYPYTVVTIEKYADGGSYGGIIRGAAGQRLAFSWDGSLPQTPAPSADQRPRPVYIGAPYHRDEGAEPLPIGGERERALIDLLDWWADRRIEPERQEEVLAVHEDTSRPWAERNAYVEALGPDATTAVHALQIVGILEEQIRQQSAIDTTAGGESQ